jgi:hypothetical protein
VRGALPARDGARLPEPPAASGHPGPPAASWGRCLPRHSFAGRSREPARVALEAGLAPRARLCLGPGLHGDTRQSRIGVDRGRGSTSNTRLAIRMMNRRRGELSHSCPAPRQTLVVTGKLGSCERQRRRGWGRLIAISRIVINIFLGIVLIIFTCVDKILDCIIVAPSLSCRRELRNSGNPKMVGGRRG